MQQFYRQLEAAIWGRADKSLIYDGVEKGSQGWYGSDSSMAVEGPRTEVPLWDEPCGWARERLYQYPRWHQACPLKGQPQVYVCKVPRVGHGVKLMPIPQPTPSVSPRERWNCGLYCPKIIISNNICKEARTHNDLRAHQDTTLSGAMDLDLGNCHWLPESAFAEQLLCPWHDPRWWLFCFLFFLSPSLQLHEVGTNMLNGNSAGNENEAPSC